MNIINKLTDPAELISFRDHVGKVMLQKMSLPLKPSKLNELTASLLGAKDWNTAQGMLAKKEATWDVNCCKRCGSLMDVMGFCVDETCIFNDWSQEIDSEEIYYNNECPEELQSEWYKTKKRIRVEATIAIDDDCFEKFDAAPYFMDALINGKLEKVVLDLIEIGWRGDYQADEVAMFFESSESGVGYDNVIAVFAYLRIKQKGFEVEISSSSLKDWLLQNHPSVLHSMNIDF